jgi:hypothetical protein
MFTAVRLATFGGAFLGGAVAADDLAVGAYAAESVYRVGQGLAALAGLRAVGGAYKRTRAVKKVAPKKEMVSGLVPYQRRFEPAGRLRNKRRRVESKSKVQGNGGMGSELIFVSNKAGKKLRTSAMVDKLVRASLNTVRFRFSNVTEWSSATTPNGVLYLHNGNSGTLNVDLNNMPVVLFSLFGVNQSAQSDPTNAIANAEFDPAFPLRRLVHRPGWQLMFDSATNAWRWRRLNCVPASGAGTSNRLQLEDTSATSTLTGNLVTSAVTKPLGRKAMCLWTRLRLCFYGKKNDPTRIRIRMIKFTDQEMCPENYNYDSATTLNVYSAASNTLNEKADVNEFWREYVKPLINNPLSGQIRTQTDRKMIVLKEHTFSLDPTVSISNDTDGHKRVVDLFQRWGKVCDFSAPNYQAFTEATLDGENIFPVSSIGYQAQLSKPEDNIYYLIDSYQPVKIDEGAAVDSTLTASMDYNLQTCWGTLADLF